MILGSLSLDGLSSVIFPFGGVTPCPISLVSFRSGRCAFEYQSTKCEKGLTINETGYSVLKIRNRKRSTGSLITVWYLGHRIKHKMRQQIRDYIQTVLMRYALLTPQLPHPFSLPTSPLPRLQPSRSKKPAALALPAPAILEPRMVWKKLRS